MSANGVYGRWDLRVLHPNGEFPSWAELTPEGGWFVGQFGSARPIVKVEVEGSTIRFSLPKQYENRTSDMLFEGTARADILEGTCLADDGQTVKFVGSRAPSLSRNGEPKWGEPIELVKGDLSNWTPRSPEGASYWKIEDGALVNTAAGSDLVSRNKYADFKLVAEYSYPEGSNSGIYLRGRYEFQILDDYGNKPGVGSSGAIYGFLTPKLNAVKPPTERNTAEITLLGRRVTVVLNGETIVEDAEIPGITGGALDSDEGAPGPLFLQGDHGPVTFHKVTLTPASW